MTGSPIQTIVPAPQSKVVGVVWELHIRRPFARFDKPNELVPKLAVP